MNAVSAFFFALSAAALAGGAVSLALPELAAVGLAVGTLSVATFPLRRPAVSHLLLLIHGLVAASLAMLHAPALLCAASAAAALVGWDARLIAPRIASAVPRDRRRFAVQYAGRSLVLAGLPVLLVAAAALLHLPLTFGSGLGLSIAVLLLGIAFLRAFRSTYVSDASPPPDDPL